MDSSFRLFKSASKAASSSTSSSTTDSLDSIDEKIEKLIYYPPDNTSRKDFNHLNTTHSKLLILSKNEHDIPIVIVNPIGKKSAKYIVFSHGNGSDIATMFDYFKALANSCGVNVVGYDYIGYGLSRKALPSEQGCYDSLECTVDYLIKTLHVEPVNIFLVGQSLGTGIVVDYVSKCKWTVPIILISPYKSICTVVIDTSCIKPIDKYTTLDKLNQVICPVKIFHGTADKVISIKFGKTVYEKLLNKTFKPVWFEGVGHNDILESMTREHYMEVLDY